MYAFQGAWENHCICRESHGQTEPLKEVRCLDGLAGLHALGPSNQTRCEVVRVLNFRCAVRVKDFRFAIRGSWCRDSRFRF